MSSKPEVNQHLRDILATALQEAAPPASLPQIVVHGSGNVFSWGGTVYLRAPLQTPANNEPR